MSQLKLAMSIVEIVIAILVVLALGDYMGYKFGQRRVATILGIIALVVIIMFAIFAAVALAQLA